MFKVSFTTGLNAPECKALQWISYATELLCNRNIFLQVKLSISIPWEIDFNWQHCCEDLSNFKMKYFRNDGS